MAEYKNVLLQAAKTSLQFNTPRILVPGLKEVFIEVVVECTVADLVCDFQIGSCNSLKSGRVINMDSMGTQIVANQPGYTFTNGFNLQINSPPVGQTKFIVRMSDPAKYLGTYHTYTSGGGTVKLLVNAWGWQQNQTP